MKTGDKKQAVILSVVAVLAIAFLGYQLRPKTKPLVAAGVQEASATATPSEDSEALPLTVIGNPFSHSKLATKSPPKQAAAHSPTPAPNSAIDKSGGFSPLDPASVLALAGSGKQSAGTEESAGASRYEEQAPLVTLTGLMSVDQPLAMLAVNNQEAKAYAVGDLVAEKTRLVKIRDSSVVLEVNGKTRVLGLGETLKPKKESTQ